MTSVVSRETGSSSSMLSRSSVLSDAKGSGSNPSRKARELPVPVFGLAEGVEARGLFFVTDLYFPISDSGKSFFLGVIEARF